MAYSVYHNPYFFLLISYSKSSRSPLSTVLNQVLSLFIVKVHQFIPTVQSLSLLESYQEPPRSPQNSKSPSAGCPNLPASNNMSPTSSSSEGVGAERRALPPTVPRGALLQPSHQWAVDRGNAGLSVSTWYNISGNYQINVLKNTNYCFLNSNNLLSQF